MQRQATCGNDWIDVAAEGLGAENPDEHGWRFAPRGWTAMRPDPGSQTRTPLSERIIGAGFAGSEHSPCGACDGAG